MADPLLSSAQFAGDHNQARLERKRAESDAVLLANRIALLKAEMAKANKKIADAEVKTQRIASTAHRHEDRFREKHEINLIKLSEIEQKAQMGEKMKLSINRASESNMIKVLQAKQHDVDSVRAARAARADELAQRRAAEQRDAERVRIAVQQQRDEARARREAEAAAKAEHARRQYEAKVAAEAAARAKKVAEVQRLEREELELIAALQRTQIAQQAAFSRLDAATNASKAEFMQHSRAVAHASSVMASARGSRANLSVVRDEQRQSPPITSMMHASALSAAVSLSPQPSARGAGRLSTRSLLSP